MNATVIIGEDDPGHCDTIGRALDYLKNGLVVGGTTNSATRVVGIDTPICLPYHVPFVSRYRESDGSTAVWEKFLDLAGVTHENIKGRYSDLTALKLSDEISGT